MKFNKQPTPKVGQTKTITKFAWFPTTVRNSSLKLTYAIWLEPYRAVYRYEQMGNIYKWNLTDKLNGL